MNGDGHRQDGFAGELFLTLAEQGRLVVEADRVDPLIAGLEDTVERVRARLRLVELWQSDIHPALDAFPADVAGQLVEAAFAEQCAPGQLRRAAEELPKYIAALRLARRGTEA
jgi:hypothetical protein